MDQTQSNPSNVRTVRNETPIGGLFISVGRLATLGLFACAIFSMPDSAQAADAQTKPDNTKVNKRDTKAGAVTADQQKMNATDRDLTAKIRRALVADKSLSTYARNVKIVSRDGVVTLKGPVKSDDEVKTIVAKATELAGGADKIVNEMSVTK